MAHDLPQQPPPPRHSPKTAMNVWKHGNYFSLLYNAERVRGELSSRDAQVSQLQSALAAAEAARGDLEQRTARLAKQEREQAAFYQNFQVSVASIS
jgi:peptidoglycan hydrolase-like protein with peptidoglycan-binding domain